MTERPSCINCGRVFYSKNRSSRSNFRTISNKKYRWLHTLLQARGVQLQPEMIICSQCRGVLYRERNHRRSSQQQSTLDTNDPEDLDDGQQQQELSSVLDNGIVLNGIFGNGDDYLYCSWCMKTGVVMVDLSVSERLTLLLDHHIYTSRNARRCTDHCCNSPRKRPHEATNLSTEQATDLITDLIFELSRVKTTPLLSQSDSVLTEEDYISWTGWTSQQLSNMTSLIAPHMRSSKYRTPFEAVCLFWVKLKTNLSFRQIGTLFKISTAEESIRHRVEDTFHAITTYLNNTIVSSHLGLNHLTRAEALNHHTAYSKIFFGDQLAIIWDGTYVFCHKSSDHILQRNSYSGHKSRHLIKMMSLVLPDGYVIDLIGPFYGKHNDSSITEEILHTCTNLSILCHDGDVQIVDRGFRDVAAEFEALGYDMKMPGLLAKDDNQLSANDANESRMVTKCRWVVESFHARFKKWRFFSERIDQPFLINIGKLTRIVAACLNKYRPLLYDANSDHDKAIAQRMMDLLHRQSQLEKLISGGQLSLRRKWITLMHMDNNFDFPQLDLDFLRDYTCGTYQIKQSASYAKAHLYEHDNEFELQISPDNDRLIRCRLHSRHSNVTRYFICIEFDKDDNDEPIKDHYCQCKDGKRMVGCCGHVATVLWYLGYARHIGWVPSTETDKYKEKIMTC